MLPQIDSSESFNTQILRFNEKWSRFSHKYSLECFLHVISDNNSKGFYEFMHILYYGIHCSNLVQKH